jgi:peptide chain release factor 3
MLRTRYGYRQTRWENWLATARRRTFAISHPDMSDAGKLLYSGLIGQPAWSAAARAARQLLIDGHGAGTRHFHHRVGHGFPYKDAIINLLDTPGHQDFSEDTYRTLTAADSAIMVIDAAKGVETQTRKLFDVCRLRRIPVLTLINKMDLPGRPPLDLMSEVEQALTIHASPVNWPVGPGAISSVS